MGQTESKEIIQTERKNSRVYKSVDDLNEEQQKFLLDHYEKHIDNELKKYSDKCIYYYIREFDIHNFIRKHFYPDDVSIYWFSSDKLKCKLIEMIQLRVKRPFTVSQNLDTIKLSFIFFPINMYKKNN